MHKLGVGFCACFSSLLVPLEELKKNEVDFTVCGEFRNTHRNGFQPVAHER